MAEHKRIKWNTKPRAPRMLRAHSLLIEDIHWVAPHQAWFCRLAVQHALLRHDVLMIAEDKWEITTLLGPCDQSDVEIEAGSACFYLYNCKRLDPDGAE